MGNIKFEKLMLYVPTRDILRVRLIIESYDGLANTKIIDKKAGLVELSFHPAQEEWLRRVIESLDVRLV
jgi:hypothetical protein